MITLDLVEFIEKEEKNGTSREEIKSQLISAGWLAEDIEEGFLKVAPAYTPAPKKIEPVAPKIQTTFTPVVTPIAEPVEKVDIEIPEVKDASPEISVTPIQATVQPSEPVKVVAPASSVATLAPETAPKIVNPEIETVPEIVKTEIKIEPEVKVEAPKIDPYREAVKEDKPIENSFSASVPPSNLPKVWTPSNIPVISSENTEVIPRLIPKKIETVVPAKAVLPPVRTPERKAELAKVYQQPSAQAPASTLNVNPRPVEVSQGPVAPMNPPIVENLASKIVPPVETVISPAPVSTPPVVNPAETLIAPPVINPSPAPVANQKPPYMVFAKQELSKPAPGPSAAPYSPNSAVTSSFTRDSKNFVFEEKKPGVPRFIVGVFIFVAIACVLGGVAFAYMTGLIEIPFLPKINQTAVTAKYIDPIVNSQDNQTQDESQLIPSDIVVESTQIILPTQEELKAKDKMTEDYISNMELQIYKKYALNKNQYGIKPNTKGDCLVPEKDSLFYTDPTDTSSTTITTTLNSILSNTENKGSCFSTTKAWAVSFPSFAESESYICVDSSNKKITTKIALAGTVCK